MHADNKRKRMCRNKCKVKKMARRLRVANEADSNEQIKEDYKEKIRRHKLSSVYRFLLVVAAVAVLLIIVYIQYRNHVYTSYDTVTTVALEESEKSEMVQLGENVLIYSADGARCVNSKGEVLWNQTFEMQDILIATNEDVVAIADYNGHEIYVHDSTKKICEISTTMPIRSIAVAGTGRVAATLADTKITWIHVFEPDGTLEYESKASMGQSGYPSAMAMSPNGELLGVAYTYVDYGLVETRIAFYNYGSVGSNKSDYKVNAYTYPDTIVPHFEFLNGDTAVAVGDDRLIIYKGNQKPAEQAQHYIEEEIQAVYQNNGYVGIVLRSDVLDMRHKLEVYNTKAEKEGAYYFNLDYDEVVFTENYFMVYNGENCLIQTYKGLTKFEGGFLNTMDIMYPMGKGTGYKFVMVSKDSIDTIQLK